MNFPEDKPNEINLELMEGRNLYVMVTLITEILSVPELD